jgi:ribosomal protein L7/L12
MAAIKAYREATGAGLKQAKLAVEALERQPHDQLLGRLDDLPAVAGLDPQLDDMAARAVVSALREGKKIAAIKAYREATGAGLKQAKLAVEAIEHRLAP